MHEENFKTGDKNKEYHKKFLEELEREKRSNKRELFVEHHINNYNGVLPIWVATEIMTFGMLSRLYSNLTTEDKSKIANHFIGVNHRIVTSWLRSLSVLRNICAHYGRLYNRKFNLAPAIHEDLSNYKIENNKLFANIVAIKYLLPYEDELDRLIDDLNKAIKKWARDIDLRLIGFPDNWVEILSKA
jgi:abortive infection bacteriophage resistance protein